MIRDIIFISAPGKEAAGEWWQDTFTEDVSYIKTTVGLQ
jgi:hypothetical protein